MKEIVKINCKVIYVTCHKIMLRLSWVAKISSKYVSEWVQQIQIFIFFLIEATIYINMGWLSERERHVVKGLMGWSNGEMKKDRAKSSKKLE